MKKQKLKKTERYAIATTTDVMHALKKVSEENDRSLNWQIERILKDWLIENGYLEKEKQ